MSEMNFVDLAIIAIIGISIIISFIRGFFTEAISLASWILAFIIAFTQVNNFISYSPDFPEEWMRSAAVFAAIFLIILMIGGIINLIVNFIISKLKFFKWIDRFIGIPFGFLRGAALVIVIIMFGELTPFTKVSWWQESDLIPKFQPYADQLANYIPESVKEYFPSEGMPIPEETMPEAI